MSIQAAILLVLDHLRREDGIALLIVNHDQIAAQWQGRAVAGGASQSVCDARSDGYRCALLDAIPHFEPMGGRFDLAG